MWAMIIAYVYYDMKLLVILVIRGNAEFERVRLKTWISVSWQGKLSGLQPCLIYPLSEITNQSEPHIVNLNQLHIFSYMGGLQYIEVSLCMF